MASKIQFVCNTEFKLKNASVAEAGSPFTYLFLFDFILLGADDTFHADKVMIVDLFFLFRFLL